MFGVPNRKANAMARIVEENNRQPMDVTSAKFKEYVYLKREIDALTKRQAELKPDLIEFIEENGETDDKGHIIYSFPGDIDGYAAMQRQRRVSFGYDEEAAHTILHAKGLFNRCMVMRPVLDEDEVMACLYEGLLEEEDVEAIRPQKVTWAFVPLKK